MRFTLLFCVAFLSCTGFPQFTVAADWQPPKDNLLTESQVTNYIDALGDWMNNSKAAMKAMEGARTGVGALAIAAKQDEKFKAILDKHHLSQDEFNWVGERVWESWGALFMRDTIDKGKSDLAEQTKHNAEQIVTLKQKMADYESALKSGKRVLTIEQREQIINQAKDEEKSAEEEAKSHADEAKAAADEAAQHEKEAKEAESAMKNPPKDASDDEKAAFVQEKKDAAESARTAAKDSRDRQAEAKKAQDESVAKVAAAKARAAHPDVPATDDEKAQARQENEQGLESARSELSATESATSMIKDGGDQIKKMEDENNAKVPKQNVELLAKHRAEFEKIWNMEKK